MADDPPFPSLQCTAALQWYENVDVHPPCCACASWVAHAELAGGKKTKTLLQNFHAYTHAFYDLQTGGHIFTCILVEE